MNHNRKKSWNLIKVWMNETSCIKQGDQTYGKHKNNAQHRKILSVITKKPKEVCFLFSVLRECRGNDFKCNLVECTVNQATINRHTFKKIFVFWQQNVQRHLASVFLISLIAFRWFPHRHWSWFISDSPKKSSELIVCFLLMRKFVLKLKGRSLQLNRHTDIKKNYSYRRFLSFG